MSLESLIVCVASTALQYYEFVTSEQFYGVASGSNTVASNCFTTPLRLIGSRPEQLKEALRQLNSTMGELVGYLTRHDASGPYARLNLQFLGYTGCMGIENGSYMLRMGKFKCGVIHSPLSKYFAIDEGIGLRPYSTQPNLPVFTSPDVPADGEFASLAIDGDGVILLTRGAPTEVEVQPDLSGHFLAYNKVCRTTLAGISTTEDGISDLTMEISGNISVIPRAGVLDFTRNTIQLSGFSGTKALRFSGTFYSMIDDNMWLGNYSENTFDGGIFIAAVSELRARGGANNHMTRLNQIWGRFIRNNDDLLQGAKNSLIGFVGNAIFSNGCMEIIRQDSSYHASRAGSGKVNISKHLSMLYSIYAIMVVSDYLCM